MVQTQQTQEAEKCRISGELRHEPSKTPLFYLFLVIYLHFGKLLNIISIKICSCIVYIHKISISLLTLSTFCGGFSLR